MGIARRGPSGWGVATLVAAAVVAVPLLVLPLSFAFESETFGRVAADVLPGALLRSVVLAVGVGAGTLALGTALAVLVCFYEFPGRRVLEWAVVLPLAMPAYVLTFVLLGQYGTALPLRSTGGAIAVLTVVLYPYVYLLARGAFLGQARGLLEAARSLGHSQLDAVRRVALPLARPSLAAGTGLAVMEALADFGAVNLLNYRALTDAIYRVWYGAFDRRAALQLGAVLLGLVLLAVALERLARRGRSLEQAGGDGEVSRQRLTGARAVAALALPTALLAVVVAVPLAQLVAWSVASLRDSTYDATLLSDARNSLLLAFLAAMLAVVVAVVVAYGVRVTATRPRRIAARAAASGYAVPGSVAAAAVFLLADRAGDMLGLVLTGGIGVLVLAYVVRFTALALGTVEARMAAIPAGLDAAARSLGAGRARLLGEVHLPLLGPALGTAALLVFVEVLKELPATVLLRPLGIDTLSIAVWEATRESLYETAAFPALCIVAVSLLPVFLLIRLTGGSPPRSASGQPPR